MLRWIGEIEIGDRWAHWTGVVGESELHRHFSAQAVLAPKPVRVFNAQNRPVTARCVLIEPLVPHRIEVGARAELIFIEPPSRPEASERLLRPRLAEAMPTIMGRGGYWRGWTRDGGDHVTAVDPRVTSIMAEIDARLCGGVLRLPEFATKSRLSPDHFRHLFATEIGTPFRRYVLWRRLVRAAEFLTAGYSVTQAAHAAGFADAAHFARVLKSTFGITATQALTNSGA